MHEVAYFYQSKRGKEGINMSLDTTTLAAIYGGAIGLVGSAIGGIASYLGSKKAAKVNIDAQQRVLNEEKIKEKEEQEQILRTSARIIYIDIFTVLKEIIRIQTKIQKPNIGSAPEGISISRNYSEHIANLSGDFQLEQLVLINKLYGLVWRLQQDILRLNYITDDYNAIRFSVNIIGVELFGANFFSILDEIEYDNLDDRKIISRMEPQYYGLLDSLKGIALL
ncbi:MAG: hypothetical protein GXY40_10155 [Syntrophomonadaceae bacterium]|nr:hypothetical protein [Syntrophomonadaceae bacterium]